MKIFIPFADLRQNLQVVLRRAGYQLYRTTDMELVFSRRLSRTNFFPRFHLYLHQTSAGWEGNLHYDLLQTVQAQPVHGEEYSGEIVEAEFQRLIDLVKQSSSNIQINSHQVKSSPVKSTVFNWWWLIVLIIIIILVIW